MEGKYKQQKKPKGGGRGAGNSANGGSPKAPTPKAAPGSPKAAVFNSHTKRSLFKKDIFSNLLLATSRDCGVVTGSNLEERKIPQDLALYSPQSFELHKRGTLANDPHVFFIPFLSDLSQAEQSSPKNEASSPKSKSPRSPRKD